MLPSPLRKTGFLSRATYPRRSFTASVAVYLPPIPFRGLFFRCFYCQVHHVRRRTAVYVISTININTYGTRAREFHPLKRRDLRRRVYRGQLSLVYRVQEGADNSLLLRPPFHRLTIGALSPIFAFGDNRRCRLMAVTASRFYRLVWPGRNSPPFLYILYILSLSSLFLLFSIDNVWNEFISGLTFSPPHITRCLRQTRC